MSKYFDDTMGNLKMYLSKTVAFSKIAGANPNGFMYELPMPVGKCLVNLRVDKNLEYVIFEAFPGIKLSSKAFEPLVAEYCQRITPEVGSLQLEVEQSEVFYHSELSFVENAVTGDSLSYLEKYTMAFFDKYFDTLNSLCHGQIPNYFPEWTEPEFNDLPESSLKESVEAIEESLVGEDKHNIVSKASGDDATHLFLCELLANDDRYEYAINVNKSKTFISLKLYPGTLGTIVDPAYIYMTSQFCNMTSDERKIGFLCVGTDSDGTYCKINLSLLDGPIGMKTTKDALMVLIAILRDCKESLELISHGILPNGKKDEDSESSDSIRKMLGKLEALKAADSDDDGGDSDSDSDSLHNPFDDIDFEHFLDHLDAIERASGDATGTDND